MFRLITALCCACLAAAACGCSSNVKKMDSQSVTPTDPNLKQLLDSIGESGQFGSEILTLEEGFEKMKETDEAKATGLLGELASLKQMTNPQQIKTKAKEMSAKL
jgi:hypothetical protein